MFDLRYYQQEALTAVDRVWDSKQAAIIVAATGTGKTEMYLSSAVSQPRRVLVIAHRDYLLNQPIARLRAKGFDDIAIEKAEQRSEGGFQRSKIVFASIASISRPNRLEDFNPLDFDVVIIDEGHRAIAATYRRVIEYFRKNARIRFMILTATPKRKDNIALGNLCDGDIEVAYVYGPKQAADDGWIVPLKFYRREVEGLDFSHVTMKGADLDQEQVESLLIQEEPLHRVCASLSEDRGPTIVFCPGVKVAQAYSLMMNRRYRPDRSAVLWADSEDAERELRSKQLAQGDIDYIFNVDLFTEGYDVPELARVVWAAPTASLVRFTQGSGRVFRPHASVKEQLRGDREESSDRRLLISQSPKPFGSIVTYYPQNCRHQLCEPNDILGGEDLPSEIRQAAKMVQEATAAQPSGSDPTEDVETAKAFVELRNLLEERRKKIKAKATVSDHEYDGFGGSRNRSVSDDARTDRAAAKAISEDWPEGKPASIKQILWMKYNGIPNAADLNLTAWRGVVVRNLIEAGIKPETALSYSKKQALAVARKVGAE